MGKVVKPITSRTSLENIQKILYQQQFVTQDKRADDEFISINQDEEKGLDSTDELQEK